MNETSISLLRLSLRHLLSFLVIFFLGILYLGSVILYARNGLTAYVPCILLALFLLQCIFTFFTILKQIKKLD